MKSKFINVLMFVAGAAAGSAVTWKILKTKYDRLIQEEIDSVKEVFADKYGHDDESPKDEVLEEDDEEDEQSDHDVHQINWGELEDLDEEDDEDYVPTQADLNEYTRLAHNYHDEKGGAYEVKKEPYIIGPDDYGELDGYKMVELTYYLDCILEDDDYHIVTNADELIGSKALNTFGECVDNLVFVRNDYLRTDYQIYKDYRTYDEAKHIGPDQVDDE